MLKKLLFMLLMASVPVTRAQVPEIILDEQKPLQPVMDLTTTPVEHLVPVSVVSQLLQKQAKIMTEIIIKLIHEQYALRHEIQQLKDIIEVEDYED